jgi:hypothetical protein
VIRGWWLFIRIEQKNLSALFSVSRKISGARKGLICIE